MIYISGMEGGSGAGEAASRKVGWLRGGALRGAAQVFDVLNAALANRTRGYAAPPPSPPPAPRRASARSTPAPESRPRRPEFTPDGRPLPPDGSAPAPRTPPISPTSEQSGNSSAGTGVAAAANAASTAAPVPRPAEFGVDGRPLPPDGSLPPARPRPETGSIPATGTTAAAGGGGSRAAPDIAAQPAAAAPAAAPRVRGTALPPGAAPAAPAGHSFVARPAPAPPGEFLFDVRCSCGAGMLAPVKLDDLRRAAARGLSPAAAIAVATQDALDAMHAGR